jgi:hypothetical protein
MMNEKYWVKYYRAARDKGLTGEANYSNMPWDRNLDFDMRNLPSLSELRAIEKADMSDIYIQWIEDQEKNPRPADGGGGGLSSEDEKSLGLDRPGDFHKPPE